MGPKFFSALQECHFTHLPDDEMDGSLMSEDGGGNSLNPPAQSDPLATEISRRGRNCRGIYKLTLSAYPP